MKKINLRFLLLSFIFFSCVDEPSVVMIHTGFVTNVSNQGATFTATLFSSADKSDIDEFGFVWSLGDQPEKSDHFFPVGIGSLNGEFEQSIQSGLLPDTTYFVRAYAIQSGTITYGEVANFISRGSAGPTVSSFDPISGTSGQRVTIKGENFSFTPSDNLVKIGPIYCSVISSTDKEILIQLPVNISISGKFKISVTIADKSADSAEDFLLAGPMITAVDPLAAVQGVKVTITGTGFSETPSENIVKFEDNQSPVISSTKTQIITSVPSFNVAVKVNLSVTVNGITNEYDIPFMIEGPEITGVNPEVAYPGDTLIISGRNFNSEPDLNKVIFGNEFEGNVVDASNTALSVIIPYPLSIKPDDPYDICVTVTNITDTLQNAFTSLTPFIREPNFGGGPHLYAAGFSLNGKGYIGTGIMTNLCACYSKDFWEFDPTTEQWQRIADFGGDEREHAFGFAVNGKGYVGGGLIMNGSPESTYDFWEYNPSADSWTRKSDIPAVASPTITVRSFVIGSKAYVIKGKFLLEYDPSSDHWEEKSSYPGPYGEFITMNLTFSIGGKGYVSLDADQFYEYDPAQDFWYKKSDLPINNIKYGMIGFSVNGIGYAGSAYSFQSWYASFDFYRYNPLEDTWQQIPSSPVSIPDAVPFILGNNAYFGTGGLITNISDAFIKFNPDY